MQIFEKDIAIDMGTSTTLLFEAGKGIVAREPTVVAIDKFNGKIQKVGQDAQKMLGRTPANIVAIHPISAGVISDYEMAAQMQRELVSRITSFSLFKPCMLCCVPSSISGVEERAVIDAAIEQALAEAAAAGVRGKQTTPFLLAKVKELTGGDSLDSNIQLVFNNARLAAKTAVALCELA